jgi:IS30 family transposase
MPKDGRNNPKRRTDKAGRAYARLTKADWLSIERGLDRNESCRAMASDLGRSPSTVHEEVARLCLIASYLRVGTAVGILDQIGTGRKPHVQR